MSVQSREATKKIPINDGYVGYTLAEPIYNESGRLLLAKGKTLTSNMIFSLLRNKIQNAVVYTKQAE